MKKNLLTLAAVLCCWVTMMAEPVSPEVAREAAAKFLKAKGTALKSEAMRKQRAASVTNAASIQTDAPAYYVFNAATTGFVVVSGDDCVGDNLVLGYCDSGSFDAEAIPVNMQAWLDDVAGQISLLAASGAKAQRVAVHEDIAPLVTCHWNQNFPFNALCPVKDAGLCVTGCAATALAQVLYYHRWPQEPIAAPLPSYINFRDTTTLEALPSVAFDWDNMLDDYDDTANEAQCLAVATLMRYCGQLFQMGYTPRVSSAMYFDSDLLVRNFGYDPGVTMVYSSSYSVQGWYDLLHDELHAGRPLFFAASSTGGGHAFVVDGYRVVDGEPYFHVNWGWGGQSDGFFKLTLMNPYSHGTGSSSTGDGYTNNQCVCIGLQPAKTSLENYGLCLIGEKWDVTHDSVPHQMCVYNVTCRPATFLVAFAERQADGTADVSQLYGTMTLELPAYANINISECEHYFALPANLADGLSTGTHHLAMVYKETGTSAPWREVFGPNNTVELTVLTDGNATAPIFHPSPKFSADVASIRINGTMQTHLPHSVSATVSNSGDEAIKTLEFSAYLIDDGVLTSREMQVRTVIFSEAGSATEMLFEGGAFTKAGDYIGIITEVKDTLDLTGMTLAEAQAYPTNIAHTLATIETLPFTCESVEYAGVVRIMDDLSIYGISCELTNATTMDYDCALMAKIYRQQDDGSQELVNLNGVGYTLSRFAIAANTQDTGEIRFGEELEPGNYVADIMICKNFQSDLATTPLNSFFTIATLPFTISTTGIASMEDGSTSTNSAASQMEDAWYDLHGRPLPCKPTQKGVYLSKERIISIY